MDMREITPFLRDLLDRTLPEMRWRCLSLAADLDRLERTLGKGESLANLGDPRIEKLRRAITLLGQAIQPSPNRAEQVQMIFSDRTTAIKGD